MSRERPVVLLVEDDPVTADITAYRLELLGYRVQFASSAEEAWTLVEQEVPDAVVLEMLMPGMNGFELSTRLKNDERTSGVPIIAFSSEADLAHVKRAYAAGARDYVVKPYDPVVLEQKLERLLAS